MAEQNMDNFLKTIYHTYQDYGEDFKVDDVMKQLKVLKNIIKYDRMIPVEDGEEEAPTESEAEPPSGDIDNVAAKMLGAYTADLAVEVERRDNLQARTHRNLGLRLDAKKLRMAMEEKGVKPDPETALEEDDDDDDDDDEWEDPTSAAAAAAEEGKPPQLASEADPSHHPKSPAAPAPAPPPPAGVSPRPKSPAAPHGSPESLAEVDGDVLGGMNVTIEEMIKNLKEMIKKPKENPISYLQINWRAARIFHEKLKYDKSFPGYDFQGNNEKGLYDIEKSVGETMKQKKKDNNVISSIKNPSMRLKMVMNYAKENGGKLIPLPEYHEILRKPAHPPFLLKKPPGTPDGPHPLQPGPLVNPPKEIPKNINHNIKTFEEKQQKEEDEIKNRLIQLGYDKRMIGVNSPQINPTSLALLIDSLVAEQENLDIATFIDGSSDKNIEERHGTLEDDNQLTGEIYNELNNDNLLEALITNAKALIEYGNDDHKNKIRKSFINYKNGSPRGRDWLKQTFLAHPEAEKLLLSDLKY